MREPIGGWDAELYAVYLLQQVQRMGIGTALLIELARRLDLEGFKSLAVWVLEANSAALFYQGLAATRAQAKQIEIGGILLAEAAYAWTSLNGILLLDQSSQSIQSS